MKNLSNNLGVLEGKPNFQTSLLVFLMSIITLLEDRETFTVTAYLLWICRNAEQNLTNINRIFIPVEDKHGEQYIWTVDKDASGTVTRKKLYGVRYVPLTDAPTD